MAFNHTLKDRGTTVATGGTSQQLMPANPDRRYLLIVNPVAETETLFVNFTGAAAADQTSIPLSPGGSLLMQQVPYISTEAVNVVAATTGHKISAKEG